MFDIHLAHLISIAVAHRLTLDTAVTETAAAGAIGGVGVFTVLLSLLTGAAAGLDSDSTAARSSAALFLRRRLKLQKAAQ